MSNKHLEEESKLLREAEDDYNSTHLIIPPFSWDQYAKKWQKLVLKVENGYELTIYDYVNDLTSRDVLEEFLTTLHLDLRSKLRSDLNDQDERFLNASRATTAQVLGISFQTNQWWYRIPNKLVGELKEDVENNRK